MLVLEYEETGDTLWKSLTSSELDVKGDAFQTVLFQLLYTLETFNRSTPPLRHNDLHLNNVWANRVGDGFITYVVSETEAYRVPTKGWFIRLFDFDWAYNGKANTKLTEHCPERGTCNVANPDFDTYKVMLQLYNFGRQYTPRKNGVVNASYRHDNTMRYLGAFSSKAAARKALVALLRTADVNPTSKTRTARVSARSSTTLLAETQTEADGWQQRAPPATLLNLDKMQK